MPCEDKGYAGETKEHQKSLGKPPEAKREAWEGFSLTALRSN